LYERHFFLAFFLTLCFVIFFALLILYQLLSSNSSYLIIFQNIMQFFLDCKEVGFKNIFTSISICIEKSLMIAVFGCLIFFSFYFVKSVRFNHLKDVFLQKFDILLLHKKSYSPGKVCITQFLEK